MSFDIIIKYWPLFVVIFASGGTLYAQQEKIASLEEAVVEQAAIKEQVVRMEEQQKGLKEDLKDYVEAQRRRWDIEDKQKIEIIKLLEALKN